MYREQYPYLYETHLHTAMGSACAQNSPEQMVRAAAQAGYSGIFVTEHNWLGNSCIDRDIPWPQWIDRMAASYEAAKRVGEEIGLSVFFGYEAGFSGKAHYGAEFLVYGLSPQWLREHPELQDMEAPEHLSLVRQAGAMVVHAHPFREAWYIQQLVLLPEYVDAVEAINATHSNPRSGCHNRRVFDEQAIAYALANGKPMTAGSDIHTTDLFGGGVAFRRPITSEKDYCDAILRNEDRLLTNGDAVFNTMGNRLPGQADWGN